KPKSKVMWQQKKGVNANSNSTSPCASTNAARNGNDVSKPDLNTSNPFNVLNVEGDDMGEFGTQPKVSEHVQTKGVNANSNSTSPCASTNAARNGNDVSKPDLNTSNPFNVLNVEGDDMGESGTQPKVSEHVVSYLNVNRKEASKPSSSNSGSGDDEEDVVLAYASSFGGGNQLEEEDFYFYDGYEDQVVDLQGALKEFCDFKLSGS
nr:hypothetical protein [Tanacetum cinerariifolium]